jgi:pSer/pThr/pTyr-binding forkhead associated (FHA) protein
MRDGRTRKIAGRGHETPAEAVLASHRFSLVILDGTARGREIPIAGARTLIGRGPGVDVAIPDPAMSRQHFALELAGDHFRLRDLGSTNGIVLNGKAVESADVGHGDRVKAGDHVFQFLVEDLDPEPPTYVVPD